MPAAFVYEAVDRSGRRLRSREEAVGAEALRLALERRGLVVLNIKAAAVPTAGGASRAGRPSRADVLEFTRTLAGLLTAGLPLARALAAANGMLAPRMATIVDQVRTRVEQGASLAATLAEQQGTFSGLYVGLARAGERSGDLAGAFRRLADHLEREAQVRSRLLSASLYPMLLAVGGGAAVLVLLLVVLPRFAEMLTTSGARLPASSALLLGVAATVQRFWAIALVAPLAFVGGAVWSVTTREGRRTSGRFLLGLPGIGTLRRETIGARTARLLGVLLAGGAPVLAALEGAAESVDDPLAEEALTRVRTRVREGAALHRALAEAGLFPTTLIQLAALGEESGRLADFVGKAAQLLEDRVERHVQRLVALAEPAMIVTFGGIVGFVALSLLQAVYSVNAGSFR